MTVFMKEVETGKIKMFTNIDDLKMEKLITCSVWQLVRYQEIRLMPCDKYQLEEVRDLAFDKRRIGNEE